MNPLVERVKTDAHRKVHPPPIHKPRGSLTTPKDPNIPSQLLQVNQRCLYERRFPGNAYVSAHVNRLQRGYYKSTALHEPVINDLYFVSVHFVLHPQNTQDHRFKSAEIRVAVHDNDNHPASLDDLKYQPNRAHPKILKHAPELMFGAVSPEDLQWNFSLSSSLGVSQTPVAATINPSGGVNESYKVFHMMSIQGSVRSMKSLHGPQYDAEDAMAVWTLEENILQRSGLPREFDVILLVHKPKNVGPIFLTVDVDAEIDAWFGNYPKWYTNLSKFQPTQDLQLDFDHDIGQPFVPSQPGKGFNFASLPHPLDEYVTMPGTVYSTNDVQAEDSLCSPDTLNNGGVSGRRAIQGSPTSPIAASSSDPPAAPSKATHGGSEPQRPHSERDRRSWIMPENVNVRVVLEHQYPHVPDSRRYSYSPSIVRQPSRYSSIRRKKSRSGLKEYGAEQALRNLAQHELEDQGYGSSESEGDGDHKDTHGQVHPLSFRI